MKPPIIHAENKLPRWRVFLENAFAVLMTLLVWGVLLWGIVTEISGDKQEKSGQMFLFLFGAAFVIFIVFSAWQYYNWHRFHGKDRRKAFKPQSLEEVGNLYGISPENMKKLQQNFPRASVFYKEGRYYYEIPGEAPIPIAALDEKKPKQ